MNMIDQMKVNLCKFVNLPVLTKKSVEIMRKKHFVMLSPLGCWVEPSHDGRFDGGTIYRLKLDYKEPNETFCVGERFICNKREYLLCRIGNNIVSMICLIDGNRSKGYIAVLNDEKISEIEMQKLCAFDDYSRKDV
jgi:hypothetical protein